jgi:glycine cleavage system regulatory protein
MDDTPVPETLETIAEKITALGKSIDQRFAKVDQQFAKVDQQFAGVGQQFKSIDQQFEETKAQLGVKIEAVDAKVTLVYDAVISLQKQADTNARDHQRFTERLDNHDVRILALESKPARP